MGKIKPLSKKASGKWNGMTSKSSAQDVSHNMRNPSSLPNNCACALTLFGQPENASDGNEDGEVVVTIGLDQLETTVSGNGIIIRREGAERGNRKGAPVNQWGESFDSKPSSHVPKRCGPCNRPRATSDSVVSSSRDAEEEDCYCYECNDKKKVEDTNEYHESLESIPYNKYSREKVPGKRESRQPIPETEHTSPRNRSYDKSKESVPNDKYSHEKVIAPGKRESRQPIPEPERFSHRNRSYDKSKESVSNDKYSSEKVVAPEKRESRQPTLVSGCFPPRNRSYDKSKESVSNDKYSHEKIIAPGKRDSRQPTPELENTASRKPSGHCHCKKKTSKHSNADISSRYSCEKSRSEVGKPKKCVCKARSKSSSSKKKCSCRKRSKSSNQSFVLAEDSASAASLRGKRSATGSGVSLKKSSANTTSSSDEIGVFCISRRTLWLLGLGTLALIGAILLYLLYNRYVHGNNSTCIVSAKRKRRCCNKGFPFLRF